MTTLQMILLGIIFIIGYTLSYLLWIWREKCNNKDLRYLYEIEKKNGKYQQKEIQRLECSLREISSYIENKDTIDLWKTIEKTMWLIQNRKYKQARAELKKVHKDILDPK